MQREKADPEDLPIPKMRKEYEKENNH